MMFVGEQPGNSEGLASHPFVRPAGKLLDRALMEAGIARHPPPSALTRKTDD
ncbi:MAG: uracil-DNA glycosylase family protein [Candidatus Binataceae bacterium]